MQRQTSILSFLSRAPPEKNKPGDEIRGTDTPPEKLPRRLFSDQEKQSPFSSIMHKFAKVDAPLISVTKDQPNGGSVNVSAPASKLSKAKEFLTEDAFRAQPVEGSSLKSSGVDSRGTNGFPFFIEEDDVEIHAPETPGMRPLVPRFKRVQEERCNLKGISNFSLLSSSKKVKLVEEESCNPKGMSDFSLLSSSKRIKLVEDPKVGNEKHKDVSETGSKFEWLDPSRIRDANGRRPGDPLYDKRTLYIPPDVLKKMSASQKQYWTAKSQYMDVVLFFKVGKFYELYELDAEIGHKELDWKMTMSGVGKCRQVGISENGIDDAVQKLIARGYKVGRMEQLETSEQAKARGATSVIERKLVHVFTPATSVDGNIGPDSVHLLAVKESICEVSNGSTAFGFAFVDCAALKLWVGSITDDQSFAALGALLMQVSPKEVIYESQDMSRGAQKALKKYTLTGSTSAQLTPVQTANDLSNLTEVKNLIQIKGYFKKSCKIWDQTLDGVMHHDLALCALGGLISHLSRLKLDDVLCNGDILPYQVYKGCLRMDGQTMINLEIFNNNADSGQSGTLYSYLNNCITSSGKRLLKNWICHPLTDIGEINCRLNVVEELMTRSEYLSIISQYLRKLPDLERLLARVKASFQSSASLVLPLIGRKLLKQRVKAFGSLIKGLRVGVDLLILLHKEEHVISSLASVLKLPVLSGKDGLDKFLLQFEAAVESDFPNYQDHDVNDSDDETLSILTELFIERVAEWSQVTQAIDIIDVLRSFVVTASSSFGAMSRPVILPLSNSSNLGQVTKGPVFKVKGLRHPYALGESGNIAVPNDINLGEDANTDHTRTLLLTGPNMGGKSTLLRATCLAVILAQLGSYVPCETCVLSLVDTIFTRLGATDRIMTGESTFFIECTETASVLQNATKDSLVILDELGRGTSTFDGYAIAYAVFRHLVEKVNCRLLFATHYHPLTKEFASHPHVILRHMACAFESNSDRMSQKLVFLYRLASGGCPESYGMQVALMAGIPKPVVEAAYRAGEVMKEWIGDSFKSSERRSEFSTLHEGWLKTLLSVSNMKDSDLDGFDLLFCLWHELKSSHRVGK